MASVPYLVSTNFPYSDKVVILSDVAKFHVVAVFVSAQTRDFQTFIKKQTK